VRITDALLGYLAGIPTYTLTAELAVCRPLRGSAPAAIPYPARLTATAGQRWRFSRSFSLDYARVLASRGDTIGATGQAAKAVMEEAHAILCERGQWVCNEKQLIELAGLAPVQSVFARTPDPSDLVQWVELVTDRLGVPAGSASPWTDAGRNI
jgi:hypothetical protein